MQTVQTLDKQKKLFFFPPVKPDLSLFIALLESEGMSVCRSKARQERSHIKLTFQISSIPFNRISPPLKYSQRSNMSHIIMFISYLSRECVCHSCKSKSKNSKHRLRGKKKVIFIHIAPETISMASS